MSININVVSGSTMPAFITNLKNTISSGSSIAGDIWSDGTNTYQNTINYNCNDISYNPELLSKNYRANSGINDFYPTSSKLSDDEQLYFQ